MPTNLPPDAKKKWVEVEATKNPREKLQRMEEFLSLVPKHKGTLKLRGQVKKQMATMRKEMDEKKRKKAGKGGPKYFLEKEGAAQIALIGLTNVGKSSLLAAVTNSKVEVSASPYTTREPVPGIMNYEDIQFQLLEAPAVMEGSAEGKAWGLQTLGLARNADGLALIVDLSKDPIGQLSLILDEMEKSRILVSKPRARVEIERKFMGAGLRIIVLGRFVDCSFREVEELLKSYRITDAVVKISGEATLDEVEDAIFESTVYKPAVVVANKIDLKDAEANLRLLKAFVDDKLPVIEVSCEKRRGLERLGEILFEALGIMRIYTKEPSQRKFSEKPFILKKGATIYDLARNIHSDFSKRFSFAKIWSKRLVFSPQKVGSNFVLEDGDAIEIHAK
ncbi:MAG: 50S ribosome-binding GTPase [Candidatus Bathyarchaeota archaeon]|nr:50S ribosome-binding GTPase [Candidatus Bathyarchaeota archaeon]MDH5788074.1 50S ribosome-binding GTPase [Candidatus Bathyarchaeota archaeon]